MTLKQALDKLEEKDRQIAELSKAMEAHQVLVKQLQHQLDEYARRIYGPSSEKYDPRQQFFDQVILETEGQSQPGEPPAEPDEQPQSKKRPRRGKARPHGRLPIPDHFERVEIELDIPEEQKKDPKTGKDLVMIGYETSEKIEFRRGSLYVNRYKRPKYGNPDKGRAVDTGIITASMPDHPIAKCKADIGLLAHIIVSKFCDHLPLYRQENIFEREGMSVPRSTQDGWLMQIYEVLKRLHEALKYAVLDTDVLFTDDSVIPLFVSGRGSVRQARLWVYIRGGIGAPLVIYDFTVDRRQKRPIEFLGNYQGYVHADAYSGYDKLFSVKRIIEVGCWVHARRYFDKALKSSPKEASEMLAKIGGLYKIEAECRGMPPQQRHAIRNEKEKPKLDEIFTRLDELKIQALPSEPLSKAINYALNQKDALHCYLLDGRLEMDNNTSENQMRTLAIGRKNWMFAGGERGGHAAALYYSLVQSCKACGVNPWEYFNDILRRIMPHPVSRLRELLPDQWEPLPKDQYGHIIQ